MERVWANSAYDPPTGDIVFDIPVDEAVFTVALILWYGLLHEHAYYTPEHPDLYNNVWLDIRRPFSGPPALGALLEAVLVSDVERRMKAAELRDELARLARAWNVELPPFPPPGLSDR